MHQLRGLQPGLMHAGSAASGNFKIDAVLRLGISQAWCLARQTAWHELYLVVLACMHKHAFLLSINLCTPELCHAVSCSQCSTTRKLHALTIHCVWTDQAGAVAWQPAIASTQVSSPDYARASSIRSLLTVTFPTATSNSTPTSHTP